MVILENTSSIFPLEIPLKPLPDGLLMGPVFTKDEHQGCASSQPGKFLSSGAVRYLHSKDGHSFILLSVVYRKWQVLVWGLFSSQHLYVL